jgi:hypothetical protein
MLTPAFRFVDPLLSKLASFLPPMFGAIIFIPSIRSNCDACCRYAMAIFKAVYAAVLVAFDRSIFNGGEHKCLDKAEIIIGAISQLFIAIWRSIVDGGYQETSMR